MIIIIILIVCEVNGVRTLHLLAPRVFGIISVKIRIRRVRIAELFAGIGGMRLGAEDACNCETVFASEINENACDTYEANHGMRPAGDIPKIDARDIPCHDLLLGGFPCQNLSVAGNGEGLRGKDSKLFYEIVRVGKESHPPMMIIENVAGF